MKIFREGLATGLILQLAIGPIFLFITNLTLQKTLSDGLAAVLGATVADYFYITLAILGIGKFLEKEKWRKIFGIFGALALIVFGVFIFKNGWAGSAPSAASPDSLFSSFVTTLFLTMASPLTIVFWTSIFVSKAVEYNFTRRELWFFGLSAGLSTIVFIGTTVILLSVVKTAIPFLLVKALNWAVGCLLVAYGGMRLGKLLKKPA